MDERRELDPTQDLSVAPRQRKRGLGARPLLESEIREVQEKARSAYEASQILGVAYNTYKKYAVLYGIFDEFKNQNGIGLMKGTRTRKGLYALDDILAGKYPKYDVVRLKRRLLLSGYIEEKCDRCGYDERRITDYRVPLIMTFIDGDRTNHRYENLRMLCFNCYFTEIGNLTGRKVEYYY